MQNSFQVTKRCWRLAGLSGGKEGVILPSHVMMAAGVGGLPEDSILLCEQIRVIDKRRLVRRLGSIGQEHLGEAGRALMTVLGLK